MADIPPRIDDALRGIMGIPLDRAEGLRRLARELRSCLALASHHNADGGGVAQLLGAAIHGAETDLRREEARRLASAAGSEVQ